MKIRRSSKSLKSKNTPISSNDNLLFSPRELKKMYHNEMRSNILKIAIPCLLVVIIGTTAYAVQSKINHLPNNSLIDTSGINRQSSVSTSTNTSRRQSSVPTSTNTSKSTNLGSTNNQTNNDSNLQAQLNAIQARAKADKASAAKDLASVNAANTQANANAAKTMASVNAANTQANTYAAQAQADLAQAQADLANVNNSTMTPAEQAAATASAARLQCIAQANGQYETAINQLNGMGGTRGLSAAGVANQETNLQNQLTNATTRCNSQ